MKKVEIENHKYHFNDLPFTENKEVLEYVIYFQELYQIIRNLIGLIVNKNTEVRTTVGFVGGLLDRISESIMAISYLSSKRFNRDSAVVLVNLIELRTDLKYISEKPKEIEKWFKHEKKNYKPWRFSFQINSFEDKQLIEIDKTIYEICSMAKHGNPVGKDIGFNLGISEEGLFYNGNGDSRITDYLQWAYFYGVDAIESGLKIVQEHGLEFPTIQKDLKNLEMKTKSFTVKILERKIWDYVYQENPKIKELDEKLEKLTREKEKIEKKIKHLS
jgi:hypothetical protein